MKKIGFILLLLIGSFSCFLYARSNESSSADRVFEKTLDFQNGGEISLENVNGQVEIVGTGKERVKVVASIRIRQIKDSEAVKSLADAVKIKVERKGRRLEISHEISKDYKLKGDDDNSGLDKLLRHLSKSVSWGGSSVNSRVTIDYQLEVPRETDMEVNNVNGDLYLSSCEGKQSLNVVNGKIFLNDLIGKLDANVVNGTISGDKITAKADANTVNGNIEFRVDVAGNLSLNTVNGNISVKHNKDIGAKLDAKVMNGSISFKDADFRGDIKKKSAEGIYNGGGGSVWDLNCVNGDIELKVIDK